MSLIPYQPREGREIVLRHHNAIVVRDTSSQRLEIRDLQITECPTCRQTLRTPSPERHHYGDPHRPADATYVNPDYFRMLRDRHGRSPDRVDSRPPSSPIRRLVVPVLAVEDHDDDIARADAVEFVPSTRALPQGSRIRKEAFSPNYFKTFFIEEQELGRGGKGVVLLVRHEIDGCHLGQFACKRVPVGNDHAWLEKVLVEVELLAKLSHPNLVSYRHVWLEDVQLTRFGPSVACAFILQQYCNGGDLLHYVVGEIPKETTKEELKAQMRRRSKGQTERPLNGVFLNLRRLSFEEIYSLFRDITSGLTYLHATNYIHRDLKPSNCLLHREGTNMVCLISDFGEVQHENVVRKSTGSTGTISYCAPEVLKMDKDGHYGNFTAKSDIFSLGMILYFMCFSRLPYRSANTIQEELEDVELLRAEISDWKGFQEERRERPDLPAKLYQLLQRLLSLDPAERPTANEVLSAMKSESSLDGVARMTATPPPGLGGRRIQNLDSPLPPATPVSDAGKHAKVSSEEELSNFIHSPLPSRQNLLQKCTGHDSSVARHRSFPMVSSRSQDSFSRHGSHSPAHDKHPTTPTLAITTPLLMPPPPTRLGHLHHQAFLARYHVARWAFYNAEFLLFVTKLAVFLGKMASLAAMCWPYTFSSGVGASLVAVAGIDLGLASWREDVGGRRVWDWRASGVFIAVHFMVLWVVGRMGMLCARREVDW